MSVGVVDAPVIRPMPGEYDMPISVRNNPMPTPLATLIEAGMTLTSHCLIPISERKRKIKPSMNTAVRANR